MNAFNSPRDRAQLLLVVLGVAIAIALAPFAAGLLGALVLYVAVVPVHRRLAANVPSRTSAVIIVTATTVLILVPLAWLLVIAIDQAPSALLQLQASEGLRRLAAIRVGDIDVGSRLVAASGELITWASSQAIRVIGSAVRTTLNMVVALFGLYFLLISATDAWRKVASYLPFSAAGAELLGERFRRVTEATLLGTALTGVLQGTIVGLGFAITGLPDAWFWGVVTAVVSVFPVLGSAIVWLPGSVALAAQGRYGAAVTLAAIGLIIASNIDNVMRPLVNRRVSDLHPMTTLVGAFAGVGVLGLPGILLGPLAITYFFEFVRLYTHEYGNDVAVAPDVAAPASLELARHDDAPAA